MDPKKKSSSKSSSNPVVPGLFPSMDTSDNSQFDRRLRCPSILGL